MDKKEFAIWAMALKTYFPREQLLPNQQSMELWFRELQDLPYEVAEAALRKHVQISKWSPSIADIREVSSSLMNPAEVNDWGSAWNQVCKAIRRYGFYRPTEGMNSLDDLTRNCVERMGWNELCLSENQMADRANFRMLYEELSQNKKTHEKISPQLQGMISAISGQKMIGGAKNDS